MKRLDPLETMFAALDIDARKDTFYETVEKLAASGISTFRINLEYPGKPHVTVCIAFDEEGAKTLNKALDDYLEKLENDK